MAETGTDRFWDQGAPYGPNLYSFGRGEWVDGSVRQSVQFKMRAGDQCIARGAMLMDDDRVYTWTVLAEGREHRPELPRRLATRWRLRFGGDAVRTFKDVAAELFEVERDRIEPDLIDHYAEQIDAL
ncbi:hypothetical protein SEA_SATIS_333 [Streptomyces phage Satis]|nr:hypothetical protein SEA_SATIS_333 [Streptomyces phage Satis]